MAINGINSIVPLFLSHSASANAELARFDDAWRCIDEAMTAIETTKERWCEAEVNRVAGTIALRSPEPDAAKAEACFERALAVARQQQAKSWELRAAMSRRGSGAIRGSVMRPATFSLRSTSGSPKASR
jgi:predicted ATPase